MSSTTPLVPGNRNDDHPIFLRVCHSPWKIVSQRVLVCLRSIIAAYLLGSFVCIMHWDLAHNKHGWTSVFELSNISFFAQTVYAWLTFSWTVMHLSHPHLPLEEENVLHKIRRVFSPPRQNPTTKNRYFFSLFYTAIVTYPHVVTLVYWAILVPSREYPNWKHTLFGKGPEKTFVIINLFAVNSVIALIETFWLSSIRRQTPVWAHTFGLTILSLIYIGWAYIGKKVTGRAIYWFFDMDQIGLRYVASAILSFCSLVNIFFTVNYGITGFREMLVRRSHRSHGYTSLPQ